MTYSPSSRCLSHPSGQLREVLPWHSYSIIGHMVQVGYTPQFGLVLFTRVGHWLVLAIILNATTPPPPPPPNSYTHQNISVALIRNHFKFPSIFLSVPDTTLGQPEDTSEPLPHYYTTLELTKACGGTGVGSLDANEAHTQPQNMLNCATSY